MNSWLVLMKDYSHGRGDPDWCPFGDWGALDEEESPAWAYIDDLCKVEQVFAQASCEKKHGKTVLLLQVFEDGLILREKIP